MAESESLSSYSKESVRTYPQTEPEPEPSRKNSRAETQIFDSQAPEWTYNNLDSKLLEFLCFLAEHDVEVVHKSDLHKDDSSVVGTGMSMQAFRGSWKGKAVVLKIPRADRMPPLKSDTEGVIEYEKRLSSYKLLQKDMLFEIQVMARRPLNEHRNVVKLFAVSFEDFVMTAQHAGSSFEDEIFIPILVVEQAIPTYPTLAKYFEVHVGHKLPPVVASSLISDIADGLSAIHRYGIVHGDVKDTNVLLFEERVGEETRVMAKIADFGSSGLESSRQNTRGRSLYWAAPEVLERPAGWEGLRLTPAADIYSFGLLAACIALNGRQPFSSQVDHRALKLNDAAATYLQEQVKENVNDSLASPREGFLNSLREIIHSTARLRIADRWETLSSVHQLLHRERSTKSDEADGVVEGVSTVSQSSEQFHIMVPFHSYGTEAYPGVEHLAPKVAENIYHNLPDKIKRRLAFHIDRFKTATTDSQTLLIHLAMKMRKDASILEASDDNIRNLLRLRLSQSAPTSNSTSLEVDSDLGGLGAFFLTEVVVNQKEEPRLLKLVREGKWEEATNLVSKQPELRTVVIGPGWNGLHYAAHFDRPNFISLFLDSHHDLSVDSAGGVVHRYTALHEAAWRANVSCVRELLERGAAVDPHSMTVGEFNLTPLQLLVSVQESLDPQMVLETAKLLLLSGASMAFRTRGLGLAHIAAQGNASLLKLILHHEPDLVRQLTPNMQTPLHSATGSRNLEAVKLLLSLGGDVGARNVAGDTPLHNAYMSIGPATKPNSSRYDEGFVKKLAGSIEDAQEIIQALIGAGADREARGVGDIPWDTPEFRQYDEYEEATSVSIAPAIEFRDDRSNCPLSCRIRDWEGSDFGVCAIFDSPKTRFDLRYDLEDLNPNYYQLMVRLAVLNSSITSFALTFRVFQEAVTDDGNEVTLMAARVPLSQLELNTAYAIKLRGFWIAHRERLQLHVYSEAKSEAEFHPHEGRLLLDWVKVEKYDVFTPDGHALSSRIAEPDQFT